jgi:SAM-dependent methyltransferase
MPVFKQYAEYYDALYEEKDYAAECTFLEAVVAKYAGQPVQSILDLGCGTGEHVFQLARRGYTVCGVDQSVEMLAIAQKKLPQQPGGEKVTLRQGDIRTIDLKIKFDLVISMFAVMSYMATNNDIQKAFKTARRHLLPGGLFIFDAWYGPGVLTDPPIDRYKIVQKENKRIIRFAHPIMDVTRQTVDVNYKLITLEGEKLVSEVDEVHTMRFFFPQEINFHLQSAGFEVLRMCPFMDLERNLNQRDWNFSVVAKAV